MEPRRNKQRLVLPDVLRGLCVISMVCYHAMYDIVYIKGYPVAWFSALPGYVWQQSICWTFILLSGFCWSLSRRHLMRGLLLTGCGAAVTLGTCFFMPSELILYGVITLLGLSALLLIPLDGLFIGVKQFAFLGVFSAALLFFLTRGVPHGYLGFESLHLAELPPTLYGSDLFAVLGFHGPGFRSSDYFPLIPWFFLYLTGYFLWKAVSPFEKAQRFLARPNWPALRPFAFIGRHSLLIYLLHQPVLMAVFLLI